MATACTPVVDRLLTALHFQHFSVFVINRKPHMRRRNVMCGNNLFTLNE